MKKTSLEAVVQNTKQVIERRSPELLTGLGIAGMISTTMMAVSATPKAIRILEEQKKRKDTLSKKEVIHLTWKCYIPATVTGVISIACLIGASNQNVRRNAVLATAYSLSESSLKEYREKVVEVVGQKKEKTIKEAIVKDKIDQNPMGDREVIITERGNTLCYDTISGRYFKSDINELKKAENLLNRQLMDEMYVSLNDFYYEIGLRSTSLGDDLGWNMDHGYIRIELSAQFADDGSPCTALYYQVAPKYNYHNYS